VGEQTKMTTRNCLICDSEFTLLEGQGMKRTCSDECRKKHNNLRRKRTNQDHLETFNCVHCDKEVTRYRKRSGFCSRSCASKKHIEDGTFDKWKKFIPEKRTEEETCLYRLRKGISRTIKLYLKKQHIPKTNATWKALPYTPSDLKKHLEKQFDENMSWDNYGTYWHIDHIIPQNYYKYSSMEDQNFLKCWSLENLRPLQSLENMLKKDKILDEFKYLLEQK
jgi:endogenous inhibitor of DNA gyrase (YacG/DUF329 family)